MNNLKVWDDLRKFLRILVKYTVNKYRREGFTDDQIIDVLMKDYHLDEWEAKSAVKDLFPKTVNLRKSLRTSIESIVDKYRKENFADHMIIAVLMKYYPLNKWEAKSIVRGIFPKTVNLIRPTRAKYCPERLRDPERYDPRSFRTTVARAHRLTFGCLKGQWDDKRKICKAPIELQRILHPVGEAKCPYPGREVKKNPTHAQIESYAVRLYRKGWGKYSIAQELCRVTELSPKWAAYYAGRAARIVQGTIKYVTPEVVEELTGG